MQNSYLRWLGLADTLNLRESALWNSTFNAAFTSYSQHWRYYHNLAHIMHMLTLFEDFRQYAEDPTEVELMIWGHDLIYVPGRDDNEKNSATKWARALQRVGQPAPRIQRVSEGIIATIHHEPRTPDQELLVTLDLAIIGSDAATYTTYRRNILKEVQHFMPHLTTDHLEHGRREWEASFLKRDPIFPTDYGREHFEEAARRNLSAHLVMANA